MNSSFASGCWPRTAAPRLPAGARADESLAQPIDGPAQASGEQWLLKRNCSLAPRQVLVVFVTLGTVSLSIAMAFWWLGAPAVLPYAGLEVLTLGVALALYTRHAGDQERITLHDGVLDVEHRCGGQVEHTRLSAPWVRVEAQRDGTALLELSAPGCRIPVGRYLRPAMRVTLARELRHSLRNALHPLPADLPHQAKSLETQP